MKTTSPHLNRPRLRRPLKWVTGLILFGAAGLIAMFLMDRSPTRSLQRLGFSDPLIQSLRQKTKEVKFSWSINDQHPSYYRATMGANTNYVVPEPVARQIGAFVRNRAESHQNRTLRVVLLKNVNFSSYGRGFAWPLPDGKELFAYTFDMHSPYSTTETIVITYDPASGRSSSRPYTTMNRSIRANNMFISQENPHPFVRIGKLRNASNYEIGIRIVGRNGTDVFDRFYTYHRLDDHLNLVPVLEQLQHCYRIARKTVYSELDRTGENEVVIRYSAKEYHAQTYSDDVGWRRFEWDTTSEEFKLVESQRTYVGDDLDWILFNRVFPELAPPTEENPANTTHSSFKHPLPATSTH